MIPHIHVHGRGNHHRRRRCQVQRRQKIIRDPTRKFRNDVRRGGRHQEQIRSLRYRDVFDRAFKVCFTAGRITEEIGDDFLPAQRRKRQRRDELPRPARHHHLYAEPVLL